MISRLAEGGEPLDVKFLSRFIEKVPLSIRAHLMQFQLKQKLNPTNFGLEPDGLPDKRFPVINDELPNRILTGSIQVRTNIAKIQGSTVHFMDGSKEEKIDAIILATGFKISFPFLSDNILCPKEKYIPLYKYVFPPALNPCTLAIIGAINARGPDPPLFELQSRWAVSVFSCKTALPDRQTMVDDVEKTQRLLEANTVKHNGAFHSVRKPSEL